MDYDINNKARLLVTEAISKYGSQADAARAIGVSQSWLSRLRRGDIKHQVKESTVSRMLVALGHNSSAGPDDRAARLAAWLRDADQCAAEAVYTVARSHGFRTSANMEAREAALREAKHELHQAETALIEIKNRINALLTDTRGGYKGGGYGHKASIND